MMSTTTTTTTCVFVEYGAAVKYHRGTFSFVFYMRGYVDFIHGCIFVVLPLVAWHDPSPKRQR